VEVTPGAVFAGQHRRPHHHVLLAARRAPVDLAELVPAGIEHPHAAAELLLQPALHGCADLQVHGLVAAAARADGGAGIDHQLAGLALGSDVLPNLLHLGHHDLLESRVDAVADANRSSDD